MVLWLGPRDRGYFGMLVYTFSGSTFRKFEVFQKNEYFEGMKILWIFLGVTTRQFLG